MTVSSSRTPGAPHAQPNQFSYTQNSAHLAHTLPPLQPSPHATMQPMYGGSAPQTPRTLATPSTPASATAMNFTSQMGQTSPQYQMMQSSQPARSYQMIPSANDPGGYRVLSSMVPQSSGVSSMVYPQAIAPAPHNRMSQVLRPMSQGGMHMQNPMSSPYGPPNNMLSQMTEMEPPTHVVGSQGRRGILPSAPGRPPVTSSTGKNTIIPTKDADGKFPCQHCTKKYLHAKHLKRHLLRHTGDRPYMCILCRDTFSRSDILKRHFQKCSIRRGNPTGASHLSHSHAHIKKSQPSG
ncbi:hypothetical protein K3495_g9907 [Podosphaera aphanis]|nr:hypothetical protein K3495_g9907 [Podosphaera aphanis]